jgi:circadian clock protein KaiC
VELVPDIMADQLMASIDELGIRRLVVDSSAELERAVAEGPRPRVDNYLAALVEALRMRGITALFTKEVRQVEASELDFSTNAISVMAENVLLLRKVEQEGQLRRLLSIIKMRFSAYATSTVHEFSISAPDGIGVSAAPAFGTETAAGDDESPEGRGPSMQENPEGTP